MSDNGGEHWMALEGGSGGSGSYASRFVGIGASIPAQRLGSSELMASTKYPTGIDLERLTGVHERRIAGEGEDSYTLALDAARDALTHADCAAEDLEVLIVSSITHYVGGLRQQLDPPLSVSLKDALGAERAISFDISNACAGMMTGVFILNDLIRSGRVRRGMVVSGEYISQLGVNAAREIRTILDDQLASLTLGDAGAAAICPSCGNQGHGGFVSFVGDLRMAFAQLRNLALELPVLPLREPDASEQRVGHAPAGGQHHAQAPRRLRFKQGGDACEAIGIRDARSSELVDDPTFSSGH